MNDAVKKGGAMASSYVGGLSGAFIPVSEDNGMIRGIVDRCFKLIKAGSNDMCLFCGT